MRIFFEAARQRQPGPTGRPSWKRPRTSDPHTAPAHRGRCSSRMLTAGDFLDMPSSSASCAAGPGASADRRRPGRRPCPAAGAEGDPCVRAQTSWPPLEEAGLARPARGTTRCWRSFGEGGMGTVYEAEQDDPRRTVALKVIRRLRLAGLRSGSPTKRNPGPAAPSRHRADLRGRHRRGRPAFFAMEFIRGLPLDEYVRRQRPRRRRPPRADGAGLRRRAARPRAGRHPSRPQAGQHPRRRDRPAEGARLRRRARDRRRPADQQPATRAPAN